MLGFWDWEGTYKIVTAAGYVSLVGVDTDVHAWANWWHDTTGRYPNITSVYVVSSEFYEEWKDRYAAKGLLCEAVSENGGGEL